MRTETTTRTLYTFEELDERAQQKALQEYWDINVDHEWWDGVTMDIEEWGKVSSIGCTYGHSFDCDRSSFVHIDNCSTSFGELFDHKAKMEDFPNIYKEVMTPFFGTFSERETKQLLRLERAEILGQLSGETSTDRRGIRYEVERFDGCNDATPKMTALLDKLEEAWKELLCDLEHVYLKMLRDEYAYQTDEEQVKESIIANGYEFEEDGSQA